MSSQPVFEACPRQNICGVSLADGPACGFAPEHIQPTFIAEELCVRALQGYLTRTETGAVDTRGGYGDVGRLQVASAHLELGMSKHLDHTESEAHLAWAGNLFDKLKATSYLSMQDAMMGRLLQAYIPTFRARRLGHRVDNNISAARDRAIADIAELNWKAPLHRDNLPPEHRGKPYHELCVGSEDERVKQQKKMNVLMLLLNGNAECYPASYRERYPSDPAHSAMTHDMYLYGYRSKIALRVGAHGRPPTAGGVAIAPYVATVNSVSRRMRIDPQNLSRTTTVLLIKKARGERLTNHSESIVSAMTKVLMGHVNVR